MVMTTQPLARILAGCLLLAGPVTVLAESPTVEFTPFVGARVGGGFDVEDATGGSSSVDLDSGTSYGIDVGLYRNESGFYEFLYSTQETGLDSNDPTLGNVDVRVDYLQLGGTAFFDQGERWIPYLSLTVGAAMLEPQQGDYDSETKFAASIGGGLRFPFNDRVAATLGLRAYVTFLSSDTDLFCASTGENAGCLVKSSGSTFWQGEGQLGLTVRF
ncbi:MAG TPA: outer membrane beta-barrel protein [Steroidobacteraceae bacterium]